MLIARITLGSLLLAIVAVVPASATGATAPQAAATYEIPPEGVTQELVLVDGTRMYGRIERVEGRRIYFRTLADALIDTEVSQVKRVVRVTGRAEKGVFLPADPNPTRLFFGPTGRSVPKGSGYLGVYEVFMPFVQVGLTDRISIGGGTPLFFGGGSDHPVWFTPKVQVVNRGRTQAAVGVMHFLNVDDGQYGVAYAAVTHGTADSAVTVGAGWAYETTSLDDIDNPTVGMIGFERRMSRRTKLISENYLFSGGGAVSIGVRFFGERLSADLGLVVPLGIDEFIAFPMVNMVWKF
jgi:hypothetical protein